jgi:hypothetical protein
VIVFFFLHHRRFLGFRAMDPTSLLQQLSDAFNGIMRTLESSERTCASLTAQIGSIETELASVRKEVG